MSLAVDPGEAIRWGRRRPGRRSLGVPPGGAWSPLDEGIWSGGDFGELTSLRVGSVARLQTEAWMRLAVWGEGWRVDGVRAPAILLSEPGRRFDLSREPGASPRAWIHAEPARPGRSGPLGLDLPEMPQSATLVVEDADPDLLGTEWTVGLNQSAQGIRLDGGLPAPPPLAESLPSHLGAVQRPPDGSLLVHGPEGPVTGGYPLAGCLTDASLARLARAVPGSRVVLGLEEPDLSGWIDEFRRAVGRIIELGLV
ncbi:MAG: biotin-dependent carboxyltransferase family protein [Fimbriimonadaceae bacterium]|nr:biotin-dependent carboxyltransferase family protein [Fimbriimonadaceae bacterium]